MHEVPQFILDRAQAKEPIFTADEVATWSDSLFDQLITDGVLKATDNAASVSCDACGQDHVEKIEYIESPPGKELRAYVPCPENGRIRVPLGRLRRWIVSKTRLVEAGLIAGALDDNRDNLLADLRGLVDTLGDFLESGETSEGYDPDAMDWEAANPRRPFAFGRASRGTTLFP